MPLTPPRQLSLFGVEAAEPGLADLAGLLAGPGQVERMGGTARVSVLVDDAWRVHVLVAELASRGLTASWESAVDSRLAVRTAYTAALAPLAAVWLAPGGAGPVEEGGTTGRVAKRPPPGLYLDGPRLRLWVAAAGSPDPLGFLLRLGPSDEETWGPVGAALAAVGLPAVLVDPRTGQQHGPAAAGAGQAGTAGHDEGLAGLPLASPREAGPAAGPAYRITGRRRLARLAELVGDRPPTAPGTAWP